VSSGFLKNRFGAALFRHTYFLYKKHIEAGAIEHLYQVVTPGSWIIDIGANIGFFTIYFCRWVTNGGKVIAIEPEAYNYSQLEITLRKEKQTGIVETLAAAIDSQSGIAKLSINPLHPGDHKLGADGIEVPAISIDTLLANNNWPNVSLIKIDVQGAEMRVLEGARKTIDRVHPAFFVEIDELALRKFDASVQDIFSFFSQSGYNAHALGKSISAPLHLEEISCYLEKNQYTDLLFVPVQQ
jgi:FkbM family methyltransferase